MTFAWIILFFAGILEVLFTIALKLSQGFTRFVPTLLTVIFLGLSCFCGTVAMKTIPIGIAYAVWAGIGAAGTVVCGIIFFGDSYHTLRLISISLVIIGIIGLELDYVE